MTPTKTKMTTKLPPNPFMSEILELVSKQRSKVKKVEVLQEYRDDALTALLIWNFDPSIHSALPEGDVPYTPNDVPEGTDHTSLRREWKTFYHFIKGGNDTLNGIRRESMFVQLLEGLHPKEAEVVCLVKDKNLTSKYKVTQGQVAEAYPDIVWGGRT